MSKRLSATALSGLIALIGVALWGAAHLLETIDLHLQVTPQLVGKPPGGISAWWLVAWAIVPRLGARLLNDLQLTSSEYRGVVAIGMMTLLACPLVGSTPQDLLTIALPGIVGLIALVLSQGERQAPTRYLLLGLGIGLGALWEPWILTLSLPLVASMALLGNLSSRHITATIMGMATTPLVTMPIVAYYLQEPSTLTELWQEWLKGWQVNIGGQGYLSLSYIVVLILGLASLSTATIGHYREGVRERRQSATLILWVAGLLILSLLTGGSQSICTQLVLFPLALSTARGLDYLSGRLHTIALATIAILIGLSITLPYMTTH